MDLCFSADAVAYLHLFIFENSHRGDIARMSMKTTTFHLPVDLVVFVFPSAAYFVQDGQGGRDAASECCCRGPLRGLMSRQINYGPFFPMEKFYLYEGAPNIGSGHKRSRHEAQTQITLKYK